MGFILRRDRYAWPNGQMQYIIPNNEFSEETEQRIRAAFSAWERNTNWEFEEVQAAAEDYVVFELNPGNTSGPFGNVPSRRPVISLGSDDISTGSIMHLIGRAMGLAFEQQRPDQADTIIRHEDRISPDYPWLNPIDNEGYVMVGDYDIGSIMHAGPHTGKKRFNDHIPQRFSHIRTFELNGSSFLFQTQDWSGFTQIWRFDEDGRPEELIQTSLEGQGWIQTEFLKTKAGLICLQLSEDHRLRTRKVSPDGTLGVQINERQLEKPWTQMRVITTSEAHLLCLNAPEVGWINRYSLNADGSINQVLDQGSMRRGYEILELFRSNGRTYLYALNPAARRTGITQLQENGRFLPLAEGQRWFEVNSPVWTQVQFFNQQVNGAERTFMFAMNAESGKHEVRYVNDGVPGELVELENYGAGFNMTEFYQPANGPLHLYMLGTDTQRRAIRTIQDTEGNEGKLGDYRTVTDEPTLEVRGQLGMAETTRQKLQGLMGQRKKLSEGDYAAANARLAGDKEPVLVQPAPGAQVFKPA